MAGLGSIDGFGRRAQALLVAGAFSDTRDATEALAAMAVAAEGPIDFSDAPARLLPDLAADLVMIEAAGVAADLLGATLEAAAALEAAGRVPIIVVLSDDQIDEVAARLLAGRVQLLCAPSHAERLTAIAVALADRGRHRGVREEDSDADRLRRLNDEVARIAAMLARLTGDQRDPPRREMLGDRSTGYRGEEEPVAISAAEVRHAIRMRRLRDQFFEAGLLEDPAWDMLLDLFAAELENSRVSVSSLCIAAAVAPTTALRWIGRMTEAALFDRVPDPADRRRAFMILSPKARAGMRGYCAAVKRAGGVIG